MLRFVGGCDHQQALVEITPASDSATTIAQVRPSKLACDMCKRRASFVFALGGTVVVDPKDQATYSFEPVSQPRECRTCLQ